jgi:hypothetical protein
LVFIGKVYILARQRSRKIAWAKNKSPPQAQTQGIAVISARKIEDSLLLFGGG